MKRSQYALLFDIEDGKALLFCAANGALAELDADSHRRIRRLLSGHHSPLSPDDQPLWNSLVENGFLVEETLDELSALEHTSHTDRDAGQCLSLTVAPTLACNFACDYCFESHSATHMTRETEQALLDFTGRQLTDKNSLLITWFGGEPTLCLAAIERLQNGFSALATRYKVTLDPASIITNGYLLNRPTALRLRNLGITTAQVTLDGPRELHDTRRKLRNGRGTFDRIIDNIAQSCDILDIVVRINVDKTNIESAVEVVQCLRERSLDTRVNLHFAQVTASGAACGSIRDRCFTDYEFSHRLVQLYQRLFTLGIRIMDYPEVFAGGHCGAVSEGSYVVSPTGQLFRCWEELSLDASQSTGDIFSDRLSTLQRQNIERYRRWDPFKLSECRQCDILPICMGGCPLHGMCNGQTNKGACSPYKHNLKDMLVLRYLYDAPKEVSS
jgi:uncharacterized protein